MSQDDVAAVEAAYQALAVGGLDLFTIRGDRIARGREYATREEALVERRRQRPKPGVELVVH
jgi:hypothetical protein